MIHHHQIDYSSLREMLEDCNPEGRVLFAHMTNTVRQDKIPVESKGKTKMKNGFVHAFMAVISTPVLVGGISGIGRWSYLHLLGNSLTPIADAKIKSGFASQRLIIHKMLQMLEDGTISGDPESPSLPFQVRHGVLGAYEGDRTNGIIDIDMKVVTDAMQEELRERSEAAKKAKEADQMQESEEAEETDNATEETRESKDAEEGIEEEATVNSVT